MNLSEAAQKIKAEADMYFHRFGVLKHQLETIESELVTVRAKLAELAKAYDEASKPAPQELPAPEVLQAVK